MVFGLTFFGLLIATSIIYWLLPEQKFRNIVLILSSFLFIGYNDINALIVVASSFRLFFLFGYLIEVKNNKKLFHRIGIIGLIMVLVII